MFSYVSDEESRESSTYHHPHISDSRLIRIKRLGIIGGLRRQGGVVPRKLGVGVLLRKEGGADNLFFSSVKQGPILPGNRSKVSLKQNGIFPPGKLYLRVIPSDQYYIPTCFCFAHQVPTDNLGSGGIKDRYPS